MVTASHLHFHSSPIDCPSSPKTPTLERCRSQRATWNLTSISFCQLKSLLQLSRVILLSTHPCPFLGLVISTSATHPSHITTSSDLTSTYSSKKGNLKQASLPHQYGFTVMCQLRKLYFHCIVSNKAVWRLLPERSVPHPLHSPPAFGTTNPRSHRVNTVKHITYHRKMTSHKISPVIQLILLAEHG